MSKKFSDLYLSNPTDRSFLDSHFTSESDLISKVNLVANKKIEKSVFEVLKLGSTKATIPSAKREKYLNLIESSINIPTEKLVFCCGGQQPHIFGGPLMVFYKAQTIIEEAKKITQLTGVNCVPLFWVQAEDHDAEEIKTTYLLTNNSLNNSESEKLASASSDTIAFALDINDTRKSVVHHLLPDSVEQLVENFIQNLQITEVDSLLLDKFKNLLKHHYSPQNSVVTAFQGLMEDLYAEEGLIVFNPRQKLIAEESKKIYKIVLENDSSINKLLQQQVQKLNASGFEEQVALRDGISLLNLHLTCKEGPRYRIKRINDRWHTQGYEFCISDEELYKLVEEDPLRISCSALIRPLIQDFLFPTAKFIGGNAEISYMSQITPLYDFITSKVISSGETSKNIIQPIIVQPIIAPRKSDFVIDNQTQNIMQEIGFELNLVNKSEEEILKNLKSTGNLKGIIPDEFKEALTQKSSEFVQLLKENSELFLNDLKTPLKKTEENINFLIQKFIERYTIARNSSSSSGISGETKQKIKEILHVLKPDGILQERRIWHPSILKKLNV